MRRRVPLVAVVLLLVASACREPVVDGDGYRSGSVAPPASTPSGDTPPRAPTAGRAGDHWHAAIGFYFCGKFLDPIQSSNDPVGIHTHGDGVIHIHPFSARSAGANATLGVFFTAVGVRVTDELIGIQEQGLVGVGTACDGVPGEVQVKVWATRDPSEPGVIADGDPNEIRLADNQLITVAFVPAGFDIPRPPSEAQLDRLTDVSV